MALSLSNIATKITQFETVVLSNFPGTTDAWHVGGRPDRVVFHLTGYDVSVQLTYDDNESGWYGAVNGVRVDGATPLEVLQNTATAAQAILQAKVDDAAADVAALNDAG